MAEAAVKNRLKGGGLDYDKTTLAVMQYLNTTIRGIDRDFRTAGHWQAAP